MKKYSRPQNKFIWRMYMSDVFFLLTVEELGDILWVNLFMSI